MPDASIFDSKTLHNVLEERAQVVRFIIAGILGMLVLLCMCTGAVHLDFTYSDIA